MIHKYNLIHPYKPQFDYTALDCLISLIKSIIPYTPTSKRMISSYALKMIVRPLIYLCKLYVVYFIFWHSLHSLSWMEI